MKPITPQCGDMLVIEDFQVLARVGITPSERVSPQLITVSLYLSFPTQKAGQTDDIADTIDYTAIMENMKKLLRDNEFHLIEHVAESLSEKLLTSYPIDRLKLDVFKHILADVKRVGVSITRERDHVQRNVSASPST